MSHVYIIARERGFPNWDFINNALPGAMPCATNSKHEARSESMYSPVLNGPSSSLPTPQRPRPLCDMLQYGTLHKLRMIGGQTIQFDGDKIAYFC